MSWSRNHGVTNGCHWRCNRKLHLSIRGTAVNAITDFQLPINEQDYDHRLRRKPAAKENHRRHYRTIWISDIHLGTRGCNAELLIDFLDHVDSDTMYLVGDIIDGWRLKKKFYWPESHNDIVWRILKRLTDLTLAASKSAAMPNMKPQMAANFWFCMAMNLTQ
jgi:hypothetical protein